MWHPAHVFIVNVSRIDAADNVSPGSKSYFSSLEQAGFARTVLADDQIELRLEPKAAFLEASEVRECEPIQSHVPLQCAKHCECQYQSGQTSMVLPQNRVEQSRPGSQVPG